MKTGEGTKMKPLTVVAKLKAKDGREENLGGALRILVEPTRAERGRITYGLHRSHEDPGLFILYEAWENRPLWEDRMKSPRLVALGEKQGATTESWDLLVGEKL